MAKSSINACAAAGLAFSSVLLAQPAQASWQSGNALVNGDTVQFSYMWGWAETPVTDSVTVTVNNTITNKIGWNGEVVDTFRLIFNGETIEVTEKGIFTYTFEGTGVLRLEGVDRGFWGGYYGPIATISQPIILQPEPTPEPTPELTPEPTPEPTLEPEPTQQPTPEPSSEPETILSPEPTPDPQPTPEPTPEPTTEPTIEPTPEPTIEPTPDPTPIPDPTPTPEPSPEPEPIPIEPEPTPEPVTPENLVNEANEILANAEPGSSEYEAALELLMVAAQLDDEELPVEIAAIPLIGDVAGAILNVFNDLGNIGADMAPEQREKAEEVVVASVIVGQVAQLASASAVTITRRN